MSKFQRRNRTSIQAGFTLIELLVSLGLIGIVMLAVLSINIKTGSATSALQARSELTSETQIAQNYIAGKLRNAVYIYPYNSSGAVSYFQLASSGYSTFNPNALPSTRAGFNGTGNYNWRYGSGDSTDPFIAFILPPQLTANTLDSSATNCASSTTDDARAQHCYSFYAYYAVPRTLLVSGGGNGTGTIPTGANRLNPDPANDANVWVLMEYRSYFTGPGYSTSTSSGFTMGGTGRIVLDYVQPATQIGTDRLFVTSNNPTKAITINLAATRKVGGQTVNVPATGRYSLTVYPRSVDSEMILNN